MSIEFSGFEPLVVFSYSAKGVDFRVSLNLETTLPSLESARF